MLKMPKAEITQKSRNYTKMPKAGITQIDNNVVWER